MGVEIWKITTYSIVNDKLKINSNLPIHIYLANITFKVDVGFETVLNK